MFLTSEVELPERETDFKLFSEGNVFSEAFCIFASNF